MVIDQHDLGTAPERHLEITVQTPHRRNRNVGRIDETFPAEAAAEKITQRDFCRRLCFPIPEKFQDQVPQDETLCIRRLIVYGHPDMGDNARTLDVRKHHLFARRNIGQAGASFSRLSQMARRHPALPLFTRQIFRIDGPAFPALHC